MKQRSKKKEGGKDKPPKGGKKSKEDESDTKPGRSPAQVFSKPSQGRIVIYKYADGEAGQIPAEAERKQSDEQCPAIMVATFPDGSVNLKLFRDGPSGASSDYKTGVMEGKEPGEWSWPARV